MRKEWWLTGLGVMVALGSAAEAAPARCYDWLLKERMRGGYLSCGDPREAADRMRAIGMNTLLPKFGGLTAPPDENNARLLQEWGEAASRNKMHLLPVFNFRGGETEKILGARREVTVTGERMEGTPCPLDEEFWHAYILKRAVDLAGRARQCHLDGAILDPEMYGADHTVYTDVCYCDDCLREFLQAAGRAVPEPLPAAAERAAWLKAQGLTDAFTRRFVERVRGFSAEIEQAVHRESPDFFLGVFLLDYPLPFMNGLAQGLGTETHPVLGFSETTYGQGYTPYVEEQKKRFAGLPAHVLFVPGLWIMQFPTENLAEQCYACAQAAAGYWIYTFESLVEDTSKLPGYALREPNERYWEAMKTANQELARFVAAGGKYESTLRVRPFDPPLPVLVVGDLGPQKLVPVLEAQPLNLGPEALPRLRYRNPLRLFCRAGDPVEVKVSNQQLNVNYRYGTHYAVFDPDGKQLLEGTMKVGESGTARWTPERDGLYTLLADSSQNGYTLQVVTEQAFALMAVEKQRLTVNGSLGRLYFRVPAGAERLTLYVKADGQAAGRGGKLSLIGPDGQVAGRLSGDLGGRTEWKVEVPGPARGKTWALVGEDITNDLVVYFAPDSATCFSTDPERLLRAGSVPDR